MAAEPLVPVDRWNLETVAYGTEEIRKFIPQRFEMEQLDAVTHLDFETGEVVGYHDVRDDAFWIRGHIPGRPLMPGVMMLETLAQLTAFYAGLRFADDPHFLGFGGLDGVKFRRTVEPGERLILVARAITVKPRRSIFDTQGWVDGKLAVEARITGLRV